MQTTLFPFVFLPKSLLENERYTSNNKQLLWRCSLRTLSVLTSKKKKKHPAGRMLWKQSLPLPWKCRNSEEGTIRLCVSQQASDSPQFKDCPAVYLLSSYIFKSHDGEDHFMGWKASRGSRHFGFFGSFYMERFAIRFCLWAFWQ